MERIELIFAFGLLLFQPLGAVHGLRELRHLLRCGFPVDVTQRPTDNGTLAFDHSLHALALPSVGIAPGLSVEPQTRADAALVKLAAGLGSLFNELAPRNL